MKSVRDQMSSAELCHMADKAGSSIGGGWIPESKPLCCDETNSLSYGFGCDHQIDGSV
jgi:hypothetical protein